MITWLVISAVFLAGVIRFVMVTSRRRKELEKYHNTAFKPKDGK